MVENAPQPIPTEPAPQAMPQSSGISTVVPSVEQSKTGRGLLWVTIILAVAILGGSAYFIYAQLQKPSEGAPLAPPTVRTQESKPDYGFGIQSSPAATPTLTSSDSVADIEKDLSGTTIESGNSSEFDADLQSL